MEEKFLLEGPECYKNTHETRWVLASWLSNTKLTLSMVCQQYTDRQDSRQIRWYILFAEIRLQLVGLTVGNHLVLLITLLGN